MRRRSKRGLGAVGALAWLGLSACGGGELATRWVPPDAAVVRCTTAGRTRMPPVLLDLPIPRVPTGLLGRQLDPMALNDMGFEREQPVCASLLRPGEARIDAAREGMTGLLSTYTDIGGQARAVFGRCTCDIARVADVVDMVAPCRDAPHRPSCEPTVTQVQSLVEQLEPMRDALAGTVVPRVHWRLAGRTDRPSWMVNRLTELLPRHSGGATVFLPGQAVPSRHNHVLVRRLLEVPGTLAVLRLDGGRAVLVIREVDDALVLDLLTYTQVAARLMPLLPLIDEAQAEDVVASLTRPTSAWSAPLPLDKGNVIHLDRTGLDAVDRLMLALAPLAQIRRPPPSLEPPAWTARVDAVTLQAEFGHLGKRLRARLRLNEAGQQWAQTLTDELLASEVDRLDVLDTKAEPRPESDLTLPFVLHRTATEGLVFGGLRRTSAFMRRLEMQHPGALAGTLQEWDLTIPPGAVGPGGTVPPVLELSAWGERIAQQPHRFTSSFDNQRQHLDLVLTPD
ncbi:MAG: hypothetical protein K0V04_15845 [Deltaproteobacteria bacterium]|nr:hypothetical protein [Deltaproteobacteria bacterium]